MDPIDSCHAAMKWLGRCLLCAVRAMALLRSNGGTLVGYVFCEVRVEAIWREKLWFWESLRSWDGSEKSRSFVWDGRQAGSGMDWSELVSDLVLSVAVGSQLVQLGSCNGIGDRQRGHKAVNTEFEESMALKAITRQRLVKIQQTEKA
jgi:hypothetical protein